MEKENGIKTKTVILIAILVVISLFAVRFLIDEDLGRNQEDNNIKNEINNNEQEEIKEEEQIKITLDDPLVKDLIKLLGKTEGSLVYSKDIGTGITTVEELMYSITNSNVSNLTSEIIMYLILNNATIKEVSTGSISAPYYGVGYEIGYIVESSEVQRVLYQVFGNNLTTMPKTSKEVGVFFIDIDNSLVPKYARYNFANGNIEISIDTVTTTRESSYLYLNSYDRVNIPSDDILELYEKVVFTSNIFDKDSDNGFKLYKDVMHTEYIARVNNFELVNGRYRFSENELNNYINLFAEYKYTFNKDSNGYYHLKSIEKVH